MEITASNKVIDTSSIKCLFTEGEKFSDVIKFKLPKVNNDVDIEGSTFSLMAVSGDGSSSNPVLNVEYTDEYAIVTWKPDEYISAIPGQVSLELTAVKQGHVVKYKMPSIYVKRGLKNGKLPPLDIIEQKLLEMNALLTEVRNIRNELPDPDKIEKLIAAFEQIEDIINRFTNLQNEITLARGEYSTLKERLDSCATEEQLGVVTDNTINKARTEWKGDIAELSDSVDERFRTAVGNIQSVLEKIVEVND